MKNPWNLTHTQLCKQESQYNLLEVLQLISLSGYIRNTQSYLYQIEYTTHSVVLLPTRSSSSRWRGCLNFRHTTVIQMWMCMKTEMELLPRSLQCYYQSSAQLGQEASPRHALRALSLISSDKDYTLPMIHYSYDCLQENIIK